MSPTSRPDGRSLPARFALLPALVAITAALALPAGASAASCPVAPGVFATAWSGGSGNLGEENWTNGTPTGACDVTIASPGSDVVTMTGGSNMKSLTLGGAGSTPQLVISDQSPNTNLDAQPAGITIAAGASVTLTCLPGGCPAGGPDIYSGSSPFANAGTITVDSETGGGAVVGGAIANTGTIAFERSGGLSGKVTNQGSIAIADGATATNSGSSCGDTGAWVKNDAGGTIIVEGSGVLDVRNFEQGDGVTEGVSIPCGSLTYSGSGESEVRANGGFALSGEMRSDQALSIYALSNNTNATLQGNFTNQGKITLTCPSPAECNGGSGGGVGFNVAGNTFTNAGTFSVAATSGTGSGLDSGGGGTILNTGTMRFDQSGHLRGVVVNKGKLAIADTKVATSSGGSCGDTGPRVVNDAGGAIEGEGSGFLSVINYEQGAGTTSGSSPVRIPCGSLKYTGAGSSTVLANAAMTGDIAAGQTLRIAGQIDSGAFANAGRIVLDQSGSSPTLNSGTLTNTGTIELAGPSANAAGVSGQIQQTGAAAAIVVPAGTKLNPGAPVQLQAGTLRGGGTVNGSVENSGGTVSPGASPGTLTVSGNYTQGAGGRLEIEVGGSAAGQFDTLAVGGSATLGGALALTPTGGFPGSSTLGQSFSLLTYGGSLGGAFASTTVSPSLACPKRLSVSHDVGLKAIKATVVGSGVDCGGGGGGGGDVAALPPPAPQVLIPVKKRCAKGKRPRKGRCVRKKCPKGKRLKKGHCVKKKRPKRRPRR